MPDSTTNQPGPRFRLGTLRDRRQYEQDCFDAGYTAAARHLAEGLPIPHADTAWNAYSKQCWADRHAAGEPFRPGDRATAGRAFESYFRAGFAVRLRESGRILRLPHRSAYIYQAEGSAVAAALAALGYIVQPPEVCCCAVSTVLNQLRPADPAAEEAILVAIGEVLATRPASRAAFEAHLADIRRVLAEGMASPVPEDHL